MERTQSDVIAVFSQNNIVLTKRRLTDWIQKGLLPPLREQRNHRGQIDRYVWTSPRIVEQAATIAELFGLGYRTRQISGVLWLLGYEVTLDTALDALQSPIAMIWGLWGRRVSSLDDVEDNISRYALRAARRRQTRPKEYPKYDDASAVMEAFVNLVVNPRYRPTARDLELARRLGAATSHSHSSQPSEPSQERLSSEDMLRIFRQSREWRQRFLIPQLHDLMRTATPDELQQARADYTSLLQVCTLFGETFPPTTWSTRPDFAPTRRAMYYGIVRLSGPWLLAADIALQRAGFGHVTQKYLRLARLIVRRWARDPELRAQLAQAAEQF